MESITHCNNSVDSHLPSFDNSGNCFDETANRNYSNKIITTTSNTHNMFETPLNGNILITDIDDDSESDIDIPSPPIHSSFSNKNPTKRGGCFVDLHGNPERLPIPTTVTKNPANSQLHYSTVIGTAIVRNSQQNNEENECSNSTGNYNGNSQNYICGSSSRKETSSEVPVPVRVVELLPVRPNQTILGCFGNNKTPTRSGNRCKKPSRLVETLTSSSTIRSTTPSTTRTKKSTRSDTVTTDDVPIKDKTLSNSQDDLCKNTTTLRMSDCSGRPLPSSPSENQTSLLPSSCCCCNHCHTNICNTTNTNNSFDNNKLRNTGKMASTIGLSIHSTGNDTVKDDPCSGGGCPIGTQKSNTPIIVNKKRHARVSSPSKDAGANYLSPATHLDESLPDDNCSLGTAATVETHHSWATHSNTNTKSSTSANSANDNGKSRRESTSSIRSNTSDSSSSCNNNGTNISSSVEDNSGNTAGEDGRSPTNTARRRYGNPLRQLRRHPNRAVRNSYRTTRSSCSRFGDWLSSYTKVSKFCGHCVYRANDRFDNEVRAPVVTLLMKKKLSNCLLTLRAAHLVQQETEMANNEYSDDDDNNNSNDSVNDVDADTRKDADYDDPVFYRPALGDFGRALLSPLDYKDIIYCDDMVQEEKDNSQHGEKEEQTLNENDETIETAIPIHIVPESPSELESCPRILNESMFQEIINNAPFYLRIHEWERIFAIGRDGDSFLTMLDRCKDYKNTLIVIKTMTNNILGGFVSTCWKDQDGFAKRHCYYGTGESFLFANHPQTEPGYVDNIDNNLYGNKNKEFSFYNWTGGNDYCQICDADTRTIAMGGQGGFGLIVADDFYRGATTPCVTYGNPTLTTDTDGTFEIQSFEVYGIKPFSLI